ncbi:MAG: hypothetical protein LRS49_05400 [Desulfurococcales archaeon]|nr:hypothetical protein [Desulfurococcales archaeon]
MTVGAVQKSCRIGLASGGENPAGAVFENLDKCSLIPESPSHSLSFDGLTIAASDSTVAISVAPDAGSGDYRITLSVQASSDTVVMSYNIKLILHVVGG